MIELREVSKTVMSGTEPLTILHPLSLQIPHGQFVAIVGPSGSAHHYPSQLSGGEQQRVALARAFVTRPALLFADEPTGNLDTATGSAIIDLLFELNAQSGTTLVLVTHDEQLAVRCGRTLRLAGGRLLD